MDPPGGYSPDDDEVQVQEVAPTTTTTTIVLKHNKQKKLKQKQKQQKKKKERKQQKKKKQRPPSPPPSGGRITSRLQPPPLIMKSSPTTTTTTTRTAAASFGASFSSSSSTSSSSLGDVDKINELFRRLDSSYYDSSVDEDSNDDDSDLNDDIPMEISTGKQMYVKPLNRISSPKPNIKKKKVCMTSQEGYITSTSDINIMCHQESLITTPPLTMNETKIQLSLSLSSPKRLLTKPLSLKDILFTTGVGTSTPKSKKKIMKKLF